MKKIASILLVISMCLIGITSIWGNNNFSYAAFKGNVDDINEQNYQAIKSQIDIMKQDHPNWQFEILYTGLDWNTVIQSERNKNVVPIAYYDTKWGGTSVSEKNWVNAKDISISYLMDPRYYLNENNVFQFLDLSDSACDRQKLEGMVSGTFLNNSSYIDAFITYGQQYGISPYFLVAKVLQEQGNNPSSPLATGASYTTNSGVTYSGYYNLFNINAYGEDVIGSGLRYAQIQGWDSIVKSIAGGAYFLSNGYVNIGQSTTYLQKFHVYDTKNLNLFTHQYMANLLGAQAEGWKLKNTFQKCSVFDNTYKFIIPVYENMPIITDSIELVRVNVSSTLSLKADASLTATALTYANADTVITRISKATQPNSNDGYYWDLVLLNNGMIGYMARGANDNSKTYLVPVKEMSIEPTENVNISQTYNEEENTVILNSYAEKGFTANKDSSWTLSEDGKTYSKKYTENTDYYTTFTFADGYKRNVNIKVNSIDPNKVGISRTYYEDENLVVVSAYSSQGFVAGKDWKLSGDGKTYTKEFIDNTDYYTTFTLNNGVQASTRIVVTQIDPNGIKITKQYDSERNIETVSVSSSQGFVANKDSNWKLSGDGKTYSKEYDANTDYYTVFTFINGGSKNTRIRVENVDPNKVGITKKYNPETNIMTVYAYNPQGFMQGKDWTLSEDGKTYSKEFIQNTDYTTIFTLKDGTNALTRIAFSDIDENRITITENYDNNTNIAVINVYCPQGFVVSKDASWKISEDGRTYIKEYTANTNYYTTFTLKNGVQKQENIVITDIVDNNIVITQNYNSSKNTVVVSAYNTQGFTADKDSSWVLSGDEKTYTKEYAENITENTTFTLKNGVKKQESIVVTGVIDNKLIVTQNYDGNTNTVVVNVYNTQGFSANKDVSWKLSGDGKTYSKEYTANTNYYTTFTLKNGTSISENIVITCIGDSNIVLSQNYDENTNTVIVSAYNAQGFVASKDASWVLSEDGKTYSKEYTENTNYYTTFTLKSGVQKRENIVVTCIGDNNIVITQNYNSTKNTVVVSAYNAQGFIADKDSSWVLSGDKKTYTKEYIANTTENITFTLKNGVQKQENIVVTSISDNNIVISEEYNSDTNISVVSVYCAQGFIANKDVSWKLSGDAKTYRKEYSANTNYYTTFTLKNGVQKQENIVVTSINENKLTITQIYNEEENSVIVNVSNIKGFTANKDVSWTLSEDGKTYSKKYIENTNYSTTFTLKNGTRISENIIVNTIDPNKVGLTKVYDEVKNIVTVYAFNTNGFVANKDVSWILSEDKKTYSKEYTANTNYTTTFTINNGNKITSSIIVTDIK